MYQYLANEVQKIARHRQLMLQFLY